MGYVHTVNEPTGNDKRYLTDKIMILYYVILGYHLQNGGILACVNVGIATWKLRVLLLELIGVN